MRAIASVGVLLAARVAHAGPSAIGRPAAQLAVTPAALSFLTNADDFPDVTQAFYISNPAPAGAETLVYYYSSAPFAPGTQLEAEECTLAAPCYVEPGETHEVDVTFHAWMPVDFSADAVIQPVTPSPAPVAVAIRVWNGYPELQIDTPASLMMSLGPVVYGQSVTGTIRGHAEGELGVYVDGGNGGACAYIASGIPVSLAPHESVDWTVTCAPDPIDNGSCSEPDTFNNTGEGQPVVYIECLGVASAFAVDPAPLAFGDVHVGASATLPLMLHNPTVLPQELDAVASSDPAFSVGGLPLVIAAGGDAAVDVVFAPLDGSAHATTLALHAAAGDDLTASASGTGTVDPPMDAPIEPDGGGGSHGGGCSAGGLAAWPLGLVALALRRRQRIARS